MEAQLPGFKPAVGIVGRASQSAAADGADIHPLPAVCQTVHIPQEHHGIGQQMVGEENGLRPLQVGIAGHDGGLILLRLVQNGIDKGFDQLGDFVHLAAQVHPQIQGHLVVPGAGGVELLAHISQALGQHLLHKHMDILAGKVKFQRAGIQVVQNSLQAVDEGIGFLLGDNLFRTQHCSMGHRAGDILLIHLAVKANGGIEIIRNAVYNAGSPSGPHLRHSFLLLMLQVPSSPFRGTRDKVVYYSLPCSLSA